MLSGSLLWRPSSHVSLSYTMLLAASPQLIFSAAKHCSCLLQWLTQTVWSTLARLTHTVRSPVPTTRCAAGTVNELFSLHFNLLTRSWTTSLSNHWITSVSRFTASQIDYCKKFSNQSRTSGVRFFACFKRFRALFSHPDEHTGSYTGRADTGERSYVSTCNDFEHTLWNATALSRWDSCVRVLFTV